MRSLALIVAAALAFPLAARADDSARCTLHVVHALPSDGGVDPALSALRPYLTSPQFRSWKSFKAISQKDDALRLNAPVRYPAPNGSVTVTYNGHKTGEGGRHQVGLTFQLDTQKSKSKTTVSLDEGKAFLTAGEEHAGGILIYALVCRAAR